MKFRSVFRVTQAKSRASTQLSRSEIPPTFSLLHSQPHRPSFGIAFDIDGVILRGRAPIGGSPQALKRLYCDSGDLRVPFLFLTNGGGIRESKRAIELSKLLGVHISPLQVVQGHSPFKELTRRFENELVVATGKGEPDIVMSEYGFKKAISIDEYASYLNNIDPLSQYKNWETKHTFDNMRTSEKLQPRYNVSMDRVQAAFVVSDPIDWGRDIQVLVDRGHSKPDATTSMERDVNCRKETGKGYSVLCDILRYGGLPGKEIGHQPPLYFAADDLEYQAAFPSERLGMGAFRIALESIFNRIHHTPLRYTSFGKPNPSVFKNAEAILKHLCSGLHHDIHTVNTNGIGSHPFKTIYMVGDNPSVDMKGAQQAGHPWFSILTRTGVFKGKENDSQFPADLVVNTVEEAVDYILRKEGV